MVLGRRPQQLACQRMSGALEGAKRLEVAGPSKREDLEKNSIHHNLIRISAATLSFFSTEQNTYRY